MPRKKVEVPKDVVPTDDMTYKCLCCGKEFVGGKGNFFLSKWSDLWNANNKYFPVCKTCLDRMFDRMSRKFKDDRIATIILCHYLDVPFYHSLFESVQKNNNKFSIGFYLRQSNNLQQLQYQTFVETLVGQELRKTKDDVQEEKETKWSHNEIRNKNQVIEMIGYDPFDGYIADDRRFLFNELIKYFDDDTAEDPYMLSQIIQIVNNNNQIRQYDLRISTLDAVMDSNTIKELNDLKSKLVSSNDKIAKENEISVKNRSNKDVGKSTLTFLMRDLREKNFKDAEVNYYDQLRSEGTQWAIDMSHKSLKENTFFDENDAKDVFEMQRELISNLNKEVDELKERNRLLLIENQDLQSK